MLAAIALLGAGCGGNDEGSATSATTGTSANAGSGGLATVEAAAIEGTQLFPLTVMQEQGIAKKHGIDLKVTKVAGPQPLYTRVQAGNFNVAFGTWLKIAQLAQAGAPVTNAYSMYGYTNDVLVKADSPIKSFADLKGKTIGLFGDPGSGTTLMFRMECMRYFGFDPLKDAKPRFGAPGLLIGQLERGDIDAALLLDPLIEKLVTTGKYRSVGNLGEIWKEKTGRDPMLVSVDLNTKWAAENPETARNFVAGFSEAMKYIKSHPDVWPALAKSVGITDQKGIDLLRKRVAPAFLTTWDDAYIKEQLKFHDALVETFGSDSKDFPQEIPQDAFTTDYAPVPSG
jgi:NitT/TauT family transport system substrate-binding protein